MFLSDHYVTMSQTSLSEDAARRAEHLGHARRILADRQHRRRQLRRRLVRRLLGRSRPGERTSSAGNPPAAVGAAGHHGGHGC